MLITLNFLVQLFVDFLSAGFIDKIGYRASVVIGHMLSALGLVSIAMLPYILPDPFIGLLISVIIYASGGGLLEVLLSPIIEACPTDNKEKAMSLLHSFYCWGQMFVVLLSTVFFSVLGINNWRILAFIWAVLPVANMLLFTKVPIYSLHEKGADGLTVRELFSMRIFWVFMFMMLCAGACEHSVSQWASTFAEQELGVDKTIGDLAGPMSFAFLMGCARACYGKFGDRMDLDHFMKSSCILCIASYLCISIVPSPFVGLIGCALTGLSVGILWPATFSKSVAAIPGGNTAMFVFLALAGDYSVSITLADDESYQVAHVVGTMTGWEKSDQYEMVMNIEKEDTPAESDLEWMWLGSIEAGNQIKAKHENGTWSADPNLSVPENLTGVYWTGNGTDRINTSTSN